MHHQLGNKSTKRLLDPIERTSEVLFGLIMALSFTCSISAAEAGREDVRTMLLGAVGCNIAWGLIDAIIFLMTSLTERARDIATLRALRQATDASEARAIITETLPPLVAGTMDEDDFEVIRRNLGGMSEPPPRPRLGKADFLTAVGIFFQRFFRDFRGVIMRGGGRVYRDKRGRWCGSWRS